MSGAKEKPGTDAGETLAQFVAALRYEDLPPSVIQVAKTSILDTIAVTVAANTTAPPAKALVEVALDMGGTAESTILGFGRKGSCLGAAFANAGMSHCLDYDDLHHEAMMHCGAPTVTAALAVAERIGGISGKQFIAAVAAGEELMCRLGMGLRHRPEGLDLTWIQTALYASLSAAAVTGKMLKFSENQMANALGIAFTRVAGTLGLRRSADAAIGGLYNALPVMDGITAALMAQRGITGIRDWVESEYGLFSVYWKKSYDRPSIVEGLGERYVFPDVAFKIWPSCAQSHPYIEGVLNLVSKHSIKQDAIEKITASVGDFGAFLCEPLDERRRPQSVMDAKFSIPWTAAASAKGSLTIDDFTPAALADPATLSMAERVHWVHDTAFDQGQKLIGGAVTIQVKGGKTYRYETDIPKGHPKNPVTQDEIVAKFTNCLRYAAQPMKQASVDRLIRQLLSLETATDMRDLAACFSA